jgi:hypothetical protein
MNQPPLGYNHEDVIINGNKRFKPEPTSLEQLPNELFIDIFRYLNGADAVYAFFRLNIRFEDMISNYSRVFDFQSMSKAKFDFVTEYHDKGRWLALGLSSAHDTPGQIQYFSKRFSLANDFTLLRSLSLRKMLFRDTGVLFPQLNALTNLVSLSIGAFCGEDMPTLELPQLRRLTVYTCCFTEWMKVREEPYTGVPIVFLWLLSRT